MARGSTTRPSRPITERLITAALAVGATARVVRLVTTDTFPGEHIREAVAARFGEASFPAKAVDCPWCFAVWAALPAAASALAFGHTRWWRLLAAWMGLSMAASAVVVLTDPDPAEVTVHNHYSPA